MENLPIAEILPELKKAVAAGTNTVLVAPPGAGKTTRAPLAFLEEPWLAGRRILMLEPRRLAARAAARYMAGLLGEEVGGTVGYRVRLDSRVGPATRIEVVTEGVLTRLLQADPALEGVGLVIFDEFHERSIHADLGLALCLEAKALLREDLALLVMSATLDAEPVAALLGGAPVIVSAGRAFPVETRYLDRPVTGNIEAAVEQAALDALRTEAGDLLVFLPGAAEIRRVAGRLAGAAGPGVAVAPLYGGLPFAAQDAAIAPCRDGGRKVVLATSIAETSLTVEGVRVVIDAGLMRTPRFSPRTGMTRLETIRVSRAAADQRRGRAGRLGPGVCRRLWTAAEDAGLEAATRPEILEADLAPLALELAAWGVRDAAQLCWLDPPPAAALSQARDLLRRLGALDESGGLTPGGKKMAAAGLHPRLAHMILRAVPLGLGDLACRLAALLGDRDLFRGGAADADLRLRLEALADKPSPDQAVDEAARRRMLAEAQSLRRQFGIKAAGPVDAAAAGILLAFAYPDRIAQRRPDGRFLLAGGRGAVIRGAQPLAAAPYLVAAEIDDKGAEGRILLAAALEEQELFRHFAAAVATVEEVAWDRAAQAVRARRSERFGALTLRETVAAEPCPTAVLAALLEGIRLEGLDILPWTKAARQLRQRLAFMGRREPGWPDVSEEALAATLPAWLGPHLYGRKSRAALQDLNLRDILENMLTWEQRRELDENAPAQITVPSGQKIPVGYDDPDAPALAVRLQQLFGWRDTPRIARGQVPLTLHLLSPANRPVQVTRDLAGFWRGTYFEVRKDLLGRYPKHYWPEDPFAATPTHRVRPDR